MQNNFTGQSEYRSYHIIMGKSDDRGKLLLGDFNAATDEQMLAENEVQTIITAARGFEHLKVPNTFTHIVFPLADVKSENILAYFSESYQVIEQNLKRGGVLVHCGAGVSRSAALVIAYHMKKNKETFRNAIRFVRSIRSSVCPNLGFQLQLKKYETQLGIRDLSELERKPKSSVQQGHKSKGSVNILNNRTLHESSHINSEKFENKSVFNFQPNFKSVSSYRKSQKRVVPRQCPKHRPKQAASNNFKMPYQVIETKLYVTGKGANRPLSKNANPNDAGLGTGNYRNQGDFSGKAGYSAKEKNPLLGTWGPAAHKNYKLQI